MSDTPEKASAKMRKDLETGRRRIVTSPSAEVNGAAGPLRRQEEPVIDTQQNPEQEKERANGPSGERDRVDGVIAESSAADLIERAAGNLAEIMRGTAYSLIAAPELGDLLIAANQVRETATREPGDERTPGDEPMSDLISRSALLAEIKSWSGYQTYSAGHVLDRDLVIDEITEFPAATTQNIGGDK